MKTKPSNNATKETMRKKKTREMMKKRRKKYSLIQKQMIELIICP